MSKAESAPTTTRRALALGAGAAADAELMAMGAEAAPLIEEYERHTLAWFALPSGHPDSERVSDLATSPFERLEVLTERAIDLEATTLEACLAKARLLQHEMRVFHRRGGEVVLTCNEEALAWSLIEDMLRLGRA